MTGWPTTARGPQLLLGHTGARWGTLALPVAHTARHGHIIGAGDSGKSRYIVGLWLDLQRLGLPATLLDPHGAAVRLALQTLVAQGYFAHQTAYDRLLYLDLPAAERQNRCLPFNVLAPSGSHDAPHTVAGNVLKAFHRTWPALANGVAPRFDKLVKNGLKLLISNGLKLPALHKLLRDKSFRDALLAREDDDEVVAFWRDWYDRLPDRLRLDYSDSTVSRLDLLTFHPFVRHSLSQADNLFNFREIMASGTSLLINLHLEDSEAQRLLGCFMTVAAEQGAQALGEIEGTTRLPHHLIIDEFPEFITRSDDDFTRMLSQTRKFGLHLWMAHQTLGQLSQRMRDAVQNVGFEAVFRLGYDDALYYAKVLGQADPDSVKHLVADEHAVERTHPLFYSLAEQYDQLLKELQALPQRHAYISLFNLQRPAWWKFWRWRSNPSARQIARVVSPAVPTPAVDAHALERVEAYYLKRCFRARPSAAALTVRLPRPQPKPVREDGLLPRRA